MERRALLATIGMGVGTGCLRLSNSEETGGSTGKTRASPATSDPDSATAPATNEPGTKSPRPSVADLQCADQSAISVADSNDWHQPQSGSRNPGYVAGESVGTASACIAWQREAVGPVSPSVILSDSYVLVGGSDRSALIAAERATGKTAWTTKDSVPGDDLYNVADPIIAGDTVFVGAQSSRTGSHVFALNLATGDERWRTSALTESATVSGLRHADGFVYCRTWEESTTNVLAVNAADGSIRWKTELEKTATGQITVGDDTVYVTGDERADHGVQALNASTGEFLWSAVDKEVQGAPTIGDTAVYVTSSKTGKTLFALDPETGETQWSFETLNGTKASAVFADGTVTYGTSDGEIYCLRSDGSVKWRYRAQKASFSQGSPVRVGDTLLAGATPDAGGLYAIDAMTGDLRWMLPLPSVRSAPAVSDSVIYTRYKQRDSYTFNLAALRTK